MRNKPKTKGQKIADTMTVEKFMNELSSSATCFKMGVMEEAHISGRISGSEALALEIADRSFGRRQVVQEIPPSYGSYTTGDCTLSIENINKICREDEQNQLAEMIEGQSIATRYKSALKKLAQEEADENNKGDMK